MDLANECNQEYEIKCFELKKDDNLKNEIDLDQAIVEDELDPELHGTEHLFDVRTTHHHKEKVESDESVYNPKDDQFYDNNFWKINFTNEDHILKDLLG